MGFIGLILFGAILLAGIFLHEYVLKLWRRWKGRK